MILLQEKKSEKLPQLTSIFISFNYNKDIVEAVKNIGDAIYDKKNRYWEIPVSKLHIAIDKLSKFDDLQLDSLDEVEENNTVYELDNFKTTPFPYQIEAIQYALNHNKFMLLDGMGLGKSLQSIYAAQEIKKYHNIEHCLVICGVNTLKSNWKKEINLHSDLDCVILGEKKTKGGKEVIGSVQERLEQLKNPIKEFFVITNIETLRNDDIIKEINKGKANKFDMIILDEAHKCLEYNSTIQTDCGYLRIGDIVENRLACKVLSKNNNGKLEYKPILNYYKKFTDELIELKFDSGDTLICTRDHKIKTLNRGYVQAQYLTELDDIDTI